MRIMFALRRRSIVTNFSILQGFLDRGVFVSDFNQIRAFDKVALRWFEKHYQRLWCGKLVPGRGSINHFEFRF